MKKRSLKKWKNVAELQGLLFFAQRLDEMLFHYTLDTYKAPTLNISLLLKEYLETVENINEGLLKDKNEEPIFEEIVFRLKNDKIAQKVIGLNLSTEFLKKNGSYNKDTKRKTCQLFLAKLSVPEYLDEIKKELKIAIIKDQKNEIELYLRDFVRGLTDYGYDSRFIFSCLNKVFYLKTVQNYSSIDDFYENFDLQSRKYSVFFLVHKELAKFCKLLSEELQENTITILEPENTPNGIQRLNDYDIIEIGSLMACDEYSAYENGKNVVELLNYFYSFYRFLENGIHKNGYVKREGGQVKCIKDSIAGIEKSNRQKPYAKSSESALNLFDLALTNYDNLYKLSRIMEIYNIALEIKSPTNALLSLWSILELLLEKEKTQNDRSRINNIIDLVMPFLVNGYTEKLFKNLLADLHLWDSKKTDALLYDIKIGDNELEKVFVFVVLKKYEEKRKDLYKELSTYPLLRFRIFILNEQYNTKKSFNQVINEHEQKVRWHLQRIYRARNCIIHDGENIRNIDSLVENLFSYVDIICEKILNRLNDRGRVYTVSDAIEEERMQANSFLSIRDQIDDINEDNFSWYLYHNTEK